MATHNEYGKWGEEQAVLFLQRKGYTICHRDWKYGHRDLDITALTEDGDTLAIVEVKTRRNTDFAQPEESVDWRKIRSLAIAADAYVRRYQVHTPVRFDIITVVGLGDDVRIDHIEEAFVPPLR